MRYIEPHAHMVSRVTDDYAAMVTAGCQAVCEPAFWAGFDRGSAEGFRDYFCQLTDYEPRRAAQFGLPHYAWLCLNPKEAENVALAEEVLSMIPGFLDRPNVLGIGEIGLNKNSRNEVLIFEKQVELAVRHSQMILVHTPHLEDKLKGTRLIVDILKRHAGVDPARVIIDHVEEHTVDLVLDAGFWAGITLYPLSKCTSARAIDMVEIYGLQRIWLNCACDWGASDPLAVPKTALEMRRRGHGEDAIDRLIYGNPLAFLSPKSALSIGKHGSLRMRLAHQLHLAYCTNIHRGADWPETFAALQTHTLAVRDQVCPGRPYAIGLRLSDLASRQLSKPAALEQFREWLQKHDCYIFTINGFPFGRFHGAKVKEQVYRPDWTQSERLAYTTRLFHLLAQLVPADVEGSVSTLPGSFKEFITGEDQRKAIRDNLWSCIEEVERCSQRYGRLLHLGVEPEPLGLFETGSETVTFFREMAADRPGDARLHTFLGVNYDTCHLAVEYEKPREFVAALQEEGVRISKIHLSSALRVTPDAGARAWLRRFADDTYLHQVIARGQDGALRRYRDLDVALEHGRADEEEWRIHFHVPLHADRLAHGRTTSAHLLELLDLLAKQPGLCSHLEMETYTWEVLPEELRACSVVEQLVREYAWCLRELRARGLTGEA